MKRNKTFILSFILFILISGCSGNQKLNKELNKMADNLNESAPAQLDEHTMFLGAHVTPDNIFQYSYQIIDIQNPDSLMNEMEAQTKSNIKEAFQLNPNLKIFTQNNLIIEYLYSDENGRLIRKIVITPEDYK